MAVLWLLSHATVFAYMCIYIQNVSTMHKSHLAAFSQDGESWGDVRRHSWGILGTFVHFLGMDFQMPPALDQRCLKLRI